MKRLLLVTLMVAFTTMSFAVTLNVAIDGSEQYISIQAAIEAANNGDTVLVHPGRYIENIDYIGKSITVCSLEATTNDSTYISQTIIDGNRNGSCVAFRNAEQNASLQGFTLTNGTGYLINNDGLTRGGGVLISNTYMTEGSVSLINCEITGNYAGMGAGIFSVNASLQLSGLNVHHNYALASCGGIQIVGASTIVKDIVFDPVNRCSVYENYGAAPVDLMIVDIPANLEIYLNKITINPPSAFYIDRFNNLSNLQQYHDTVNAQLAHRSEINRDFYVSPDGNDSNSGISPDEPMRTITRAMHLIASDSLDVKTIHLLPGVYEEGEGEQLYPIPIKSHTNLIGTGSSEVTIYSETESNIGYTIFIFATRTTHNTISGMKITGSANSIRSVFMGTFSQSQLYLCDLQIVDLPVSDYGGALYMSKPTSAIIDNLVINNITTLENAIYMNKISDTRISNSTFTNIHSMYVSDDLFFSGISIIGFWVADSLTIENCEFRNISVQNDQPTFGISTWNSLTAQDVNIRLSNTLFDNIRTNNDRAMFFGSNDYSNVEISNCTFYNNFASLAAVGLIGNVSMRNNIFFNPDADNEIVMYAPSRRQDPCNLDIDYSYIRGGEVSINNISTYNNLNYGEHNLSAGSLFADTNAGNVEYLRLAPGSPCIDAGTPDISLLGLPPYDLAGNQRVWNGIIDMGAYEYSSEPWVSIDDPELPAIDQLVLRQNYPNPFNPSTTIAYSLPEAAKVRLDIYNVKGQLVKTLVNGEMPGGTHSVVWNGRDNDNNAVASGVYFYRVSSPKATRTKRMLLMK